MGGYLAGATIIAMQAGLVAGVFAAIVGLPYPWAIALGAALLDYIPVIGPIIVGVSMMLLGFTQSLTIGLDRRRLLHLPAPVRGVLALPQGDAPDGGHLRRRGGRGDRHRRRAARA